MPTISQIIKKHRVKKHRSKHLPALEKCPQKKGVCVKLVTRTPKKPNSAIRKLALVRLSNRKRVYGYIPGEGKHSLQEHSIVLVRGGRVKDLPGIKYKLVRGVYDFAGLKGRRNARSKYGIKRSMILLLVFIYATFSKTHNLPSISYRRLKPMAYYGSNGKFFYSIRFCTLYAYIPSWFYPIFPRAY